MTSYVFSISTVQNPKNVIYLIKRTPHVEVNMNYYSYSGKKSQSRRRENKKRIIIKIIIILLAIILSVAFALILGNHLKHKLDEANLSTEPVDELLSSFEPVETDVAAGIEFVKNDRAEGEMAGIFGYLDLDGCPDEASAQSFVAALRESGYTGVLFNVKSGDGKYSYASPAASNLSKTELPSGIPSLALVSGAFGAASGSGMRSAAYVYLDDVFSKEESAKVGAAIDRAVIVEMAEAGVSEIIFDGIARDRDFTVDFVKELYEFISPVRKKCSGTDFGLVISTAVLENPECTPALEIAFRFIDFFALDMSKEEYTPEVVAGFLDKYSGSVAAYSILAIADGKDLSSLKRSAEAFSPEKNENVAFIAPRTDYKPNKDGKITYSQKIEKYSLTEGSTTDK